MNWRYPYIVYGSVRPAFTAHAIKNGNYIICFIELDPVRDVAWKEYNALRASGRPPPMKDITFLFKTSSDL